MPKPKAGGERIKLEALNSCGSSGFPVGEFMVLQQPQYSLELQALAPQGLRRQPPHPRLPRGRGYKTCSIQDLLTRAVPGVTSTSGGSRRPGSAAEPRRASSLPTQNLEEPFMHYFSIMPSRLFNIDCTHSSRLRESPANPKLFNIWPSGLYKV